MGFKLGDQVRLTGTLVKVKENNRTDFKEAPLPEDNMGYLASRDRNDVKRTLSTGIIVGMRRRPYGYTDPEKPQPNFVREGFQLVYIVAVTLKTAHVQCFPEQLSLIRRAKLVPRFRAEEGKKK